MFRTIRNVLSNLSEHSMQAANEAKTGGAVRIGLLGLYGWGNLGDVAIQEAVMQQFELRLPDVEFIGLSLNPADTRVRHGIESFAITKHQFEQTGSQKTDSPEKTGSDHSDQAENHQADSTLGFYSRTKRYLVGNPITRFPFVVVRKLWRTVGFLATEVRFCKYILSIAKRLDLLVFSGGGLLDEYWGGPWHHPLTLMRWAIAARISGRKCIMLSAGASQFESKLSRFFLRQTLRQCTYRSFREETSLEKVRSLGVQEPNLCFPDLAYSLETELYKIGTVDTNANVTLGISPIAWMDPRSWPEKDENKYREYVNRMAELVKESIARGYRVRMYASDIHMDKLVIDDIAAASSLSENELLRIYNIEELSEMLELVAECDIIVAARLHGVLLSHLLGKPVVALSYDQKVDLLMDETGQSELCLSIESAGNTEVFDAISRIQSQADIQTDRINATVSKYRELLSRQYDQVVTSFCLDRQSSKTGIS